MGLASTSKSRPCRRAASSNSPVSATPERSKTSQVGHFSFERTVRSIPDNPGIIHVRNDQVGLNDSSGFQRVHETGGVVTIKLENVCRGSSYDSIIVNDKDTRDQPQPTFSQSDRCGLSRLTFQVEGLAGPEALMA
jgi:hypothetical protein